MKVILTESVEKLGQEGEVKEVANGYARNFLFPRGLAIPATAGALKQAEARRTHQQRQVARIVSEAEQMAARLNGLSVLLFARTGEQNRLYGSVTAADVANALKAEHGVTVDRRKLSLDNPIHRTGNYTATASLGRNINAKINVTVESEANRATVLEARRQAAEAAAQEAAGPLQAVADTAGTVAQTVTDTAGTVAQTVVGAVAPVAHTVADTAGSVAGAVADAAGPVAQTVADTAGNVAQAVTSGVGALVGRVTGQAATTDDAQPEETGTEDTASADTGAAETADTVDAPTADTTTDEPADADTAATAAANTAFDDAGVSPDADAEIAGATAGALESGTLDTPAEESQEPAAAEPEEASGQ